LLPSGVTMITADPEGPATFSTQCVAIPTDARASRSCGAKPGYRLPRYRHALHGGHEIKIDASNNNDFSSYGPILRVRYLEISGATAIAPSPVRKKKNIQGMRRFDVGGADANSFQIHDSPKGRDHGCALPECVGDCGPYGTRARCNKAGNRSGTPHRCRRHPTRNRREARSDAGGAARVNGIPFDEGRTQPLKEGRPYFSSGKSIDQSGGSDSTMARTHVPLSLWWSSWLHLTPSP
jgi:hypothetical protein